jgi:XTP/dITP diphosphohydrolase
MMKLLLATNNKHKIREFEQIFAGLSFEITYPAREGLNLEPEETGSTFAENAIIKARAFAEASGLLTLADDSGLEVDALNGEPGVYSARYGGTAKDDHLGRCRLVLNKLAALDIPDEARTARFRCVIAIVSPEGKIELAEGIIEGRIAYAPVGENGFGYDPIFLVPELNQTTAQLSPVDKNKISHRAQAARAAIPLLQKLK